MFAHAISSTNAVTPSSSVIGSPASLRAELCPRLPSVRSSGLVLNRAIV